jgi:hypothetical protein
MNFDNLNKTEDLLKTVETYLKVYFQNIERKNNKIICKTKTTTEFIIDDVNETTVDGFEIKRCYTVVTLLPVNTSLKRIAFLNNFSALSSLILFEDEKKIKWISRFYEYGGDNVHQKFLIPSLITTAMNNESALLEVTKQFSPKAESTKEPNYEEVESRWLTSSEFEETQSFFKDSFSCSALKSGMFVEFPLDDDASSGDKASSLEFQTHHKHPFYGSGLFCKLSLPVKSTDTSIIINKLNLNEFSNPDAPPFIGSWCSGFKDELQIINFVCFFPNNVYFKGMVKNIITWMFARATIAKGFLE